MLFFIVHVTTCLIKFFFIINDTLDLLRREKQEKYCLGVSKANEHSLVWEFRFKNSVNEPILAGFHREKLYKLHVQTEVQCTKETAQYHQENSIVDAICKTFLHREKKCKILFHYEAVATLSLTSSCFLEGFLCCSNHEVSMKYIF
jgi:hypothetical protein